MHHGQETYSTTKIEQEMQLFLMVAWNRHEIFLANKWCLRAKDRQAVWKLATRDSFDPEFFDPPPAPSAPLSEFHDHNHTAMME